MRKLVTKDRIGQGFLPLERQPKYKWPIGFGKTINNIDYDSYYFFGFDTETKGLNPYHPQSFLISFSISPEVGEAGAIRLNFNGEVAQDFEYENLKRLLANPDKTLVGHNIKYDLNWILVKLGWTVNAQVFDTMLAEYFLDENRPADLGTVLSNHLNDTSGYKDMVNKSDLESEALDDVLLYNAMDAEAEMRLLPVMISKLKKQKVLKLALLGMRILPILSKMECKGVRIDLDKARENRKELVEQSVRYRLQLKNQYGKFDPDSPIDLSKMLFSTIGFQSERLTKSGNASTDYETLKLLYDQVKNKQQKEFLDTIIPYKKGMKLLSSLYQKVEEQVKYDGRFHPRYNLGKQYGEDTGGTVTGRLSGNMQQVPRGKEHKGIFIPADGYCFVDGDFSQLELRVVAFLAKEPVMIQAFEEGKDIHTAVMADLLHLDYDELTQALEDSNDLKHSEYKELRVAIKRINFGIVYGVAGDRLRRLLKVEMGLDKTLEWCENLISQWLDKYKNVAQFLQQTKDFASATQYVRMLFGQKRRLPDACRLVWGMDGEKRKASSRALRQAQNFVVQSVASWIMLIGMILVDEYLQSKPELDGQMVIQVHDSGTWEIKLSNDLNEIALDIQDIMENKTKEFILEYFGIDFDVPLKFETKILERWE